jgi:hypothetical protein
MKLIEAVAYSSGNKAKAINDKGITVIVQERYDNENIWWHAWILTHPNTIKRHITILKHLSMFGVEAEEDYWAPI